MHIQLNEEGSCVITVNESTTVYLTVFPPAILPPPVRDYDVPILNIDARDFDASEWDLTTQQVGICAPTRLTKNARELLTFENGTYRLGSRKDFFQGGNTTVGFFQI